MDKNKGVLIAGGGLGGIAAAIAVARMGRRVVIVEESDWLGGQLTSQAVPPDDCATTPCFQTLHDRPLSTLGPGA